MTKRYCTVLNLGLIEYERVWKYQRALVEKICQNRRNNNNSQDYLILCQHPPVYTLGRGGLITNIKNIDTKGNVPVFRVERGGDITYHGPGQQIIYPIFDLTNHIKDLHWYVRTLEETVISTLQQFGIVGHRNSLNSGVWIGNSKISAVGIAASRWVTMHGVSINAFCDMSYFQNIIPCGISDPSAKVCSMTEVLSSFDLKISNKDMMSRLETIWMEQISNQFHVTIIKGVDKQSDLNNNIEEISVLNDEIVLERILDNYPDIKKDSLKKITP